MKTLLIIIGAIIAILVFIIVYTYNEFTYQPDYFEKMEKVNISKINKQAFETEKRIKEELKQNKVARLNGEEIVQIGLSHIARQSHIDIDKVVKKVKGDIVDGQLKTEALLNIKALTKQKVSPKVHKFIDMFSKFAPDNMLDNVYVSIEGKPVNDNGILRFNDDATISVGDFKKPVSDFIHDHDIKIDMDMLKKLGLTDIIVHNNYLELKNSP